MISRPGHAVTAPPDNADNLLEPTVPPVPLALQLPDDVRADLDSQIRLSRYAGYVALAEWLASTHGYSIGKSTLATYGKALMGADAESGTSDFGNMRRAMAAARIPSRIDDLLRELGRLRLREHQILTEIEALGGTSAADCG